MSGQDRQCYDASWMSEDGEPGAAPGLIAILATPGELLDRITILRIRRARVASPAQLTDVSAALARAERAWAVAGMDGTATADLAEALRAVNQSLWDAEDLVRDCERRHNFGPSFVDAARAIARLNDHRAALRREVSARCGLRAGDDVKIYGK